MRAKKMLMDESAMRTSSSVNQTNMSRTIGTQGVHREKGAALNVALTKEPLGQEATT